MIPKPLAWLALVLALCGLAYCAGTRDAETTRATRADSIRTVRDTIRVAEYKVKTDTLYLRATRAESDERIGKATVVMPPDTVPVVPLDTVTAVLADERAACDSALASLRALVQHYRTLDTLNTAQIAVERVGRIRFRDRIGVSVGYGAQLGNDGLVRVGPQVMVGVKLWP